MELVANLNEIGDIPEIAVDGIGRIEVHNGRLRVTLMRVTSRKGERTEEACISIVWSVAAWMDCQAALQQMRDVITTQGSSAMLMDAPRQAH